VLARVAGVGACIDLSDGLEADLAHLLEGTDLAAEIEPGRLPLPPRFRAACARLGLDPERLLRTGGEDYELLFTLRAGAPGSAALCRRLGVRVSEIGRLLRAGRRRGRRSGSPGGWTHF
jgi:thiamine-monophosphate kinase